MKKETSQTDLNNNTTKMENVTIPRAVSRYVGSPVRDNDLHIVTEFLVSVGFLDLGPII